MLKGVVDNFPLPKEECGVAIIKRFSVSEEEAKSYNMRLLFSGGFGLQRIESGDYVKLIVNGELMMSDTRMEKFTNRDFISNAHGEVMIAGLGIGLILENLIPLCESGKVTRVVVYEKYQDVIDLVASRYVSRMPLEVHLADIMEYHPLKEEKYDTIYFDIWPVIEEDNLKDIRILHNRWKNHKKAGAWMDSWMAHHLRRRRDNERRSNYGWF